MLGIVVAAGEYDPPRRLGEWRQRAGFVVAANGGAAHAARMGLPPNLIVGDMDSLPEEVRWEMVAAGAMRQRHRPDKDETDTELAMRAAVDRGCDELVILCALGGRLDHSLANILLLALPGLEDRALLAAGDTEVRLIATEGSFSGAPGDILSLLPLGTDVRGIWTEGLQYALADGALRLGHARGVSNVFTQPRARVTIGEGRLLAVHIRKSGGSWESTDG